MENNENKNNKGLIVIMVIVGVCACVGAFLLGMHLSNVEENKVPENGSSEKQNNNENVPINGDEETIIKKLYENFKNGNDKNITAEEISTKVKCYGMNDAFEEFEDECDVKKTEYKYGKYVVDILPYDASVDANSITILDQNNKQVYYNEDVKTTIYLDDYISFNPYISSGKLYFISYDAADCYTGEDDVKQPYLKYGYIDLNSDNIKVNYLNTFKEIAFEGMGPFCK